MVTEQKYIRIKKQLIPVSEEIYLAYYRMERHERTIQEKDIRNGVLLYSELGEYDDTGLDSLPDNIQLSPEEYSEKNILSEQLHLCLTKLSLQEQELIAALFFSEKTERQFAHQKGLSQASINKQKKKILLKLKKLMKI